MKNKKPKHGGYPESVNKPDKFLTPERIESLKDKIVQDKDNVQAIAHYYGCDDFLELLVQVLLNASEEMEDISKQSSDLYMLRANQISEILETQLEDE